MTATTPEVGPGWASAVLTMEHAVDERGRVAPTTVRDGEGGHVGDVVPAPRGEVGRALLTLTRASLMVAERYEIVDLAGAAVLCLRRPAPVFTPVLHVLDPHDREVGRIVTTSAGGWDVAQLQAPAGTVGALRPVPSSSEAVAVVDTAGHEVARITFESDGADQGAPAPRRWRFSCVATPPEPLRTLALAVGVAADLVLLDPGRGIT